MATLLITGANRGLGLEFTRQYADDGHRVIACCRNPDAASELRQLAGQVEVVALELCNTRQISAVASALQGVAIDVLINNAATFGGSRFRLPELDGARMLTALETNVVGPLMLTRSLLENLALSAAGKVMFLSSRAGLAREARQSGSIIYRASKAALNAAVRSASFDLAARGIACAALNPGFVRTGIGGPKAPMTTFQSVTALRSVINGITLANTGCFWHFDGTQIEF
ncbi:MAG: SDR family oxidoreductase [Halioglobus sp.]